MSLNKYLLGLLRGLKCKHKSKSIVVIDGFAEWEVIAVKCNDCGNKL